ncbi:MAG: hypothetical protein IKD72_08630, partial [Clostridia bacterium]|nr:hypothetical protein [Clostridia bacterium]
TLDLPFSWPGAISYELKFSSACEFEDGYDYLYILDAEGNELGSYTGTSLQNKKISVDSSSFTIRVVTDKSDNAYGFALTGVTVSTRGDLKVTEVPALGHDYAQVTLVASTCKKQGEYALRCTRCGAIELEDPTDLSPVESTADASTYPESPHNYSNDEQYRYHFTYPGATQLTLHFSPDCELENNFDYLYLYDGSGAQIGKYTGTVLKNKTVTVPGDSFSIKMTTDWWITKYGFSFSSIDVTTNGTVKRYPKPLADHDYFHTVTRAPTPLETGLMTHICRNCGSSYTTVMPKTLYNVGEIVTYGSYPQSRVTDDALIDALAGQSLTWKSYGYFSGDGSTDEGIINGNLAPDRYMWYADLNYGGERYRAVTFSKYRPIATGAVAATVGTYSMQDNNGYGLNHVYWFKYDPIQWRVLDPTRGLVVSETVLDAQAYNNYVIYFLLCFFNDPDYEHFANDYVNSSIRYWLNHDFYNTAFTDEQKANVLDTTIHNLSYETLCGEAKGTPYDGETVTDKVFLLAYDDVVNNADYQFSSAQGASATRRASATDYARSQGVAVAGNGSSVWYLRTATEWSAFTCLVGYEGDLHITDDDKAMFVGATAVGIRPALRLKNITPNGGDVVEGPVHTVTYSIGGNVIGQLSIQTGDPMVLLTASAPSGYAFSGWDAPEEMPDHDLTLTGEYLPIHTATFVADGVTIGTAEFTTASGTLYEPAVPEKNGFTGVWESYNLQTATGDITINAIYESIPCDHVDANSDGVCDTCGEMLTYTKAIIVNGVNLGTVSYTYGATVLQDLPDVPAKVGYTGQWDYTISGSELSILPVYAPITYYATFMADGEQVGERIPFTVESTSIAEPSVPTKLGYNGR